MIHKPLSTRFVPLNLLGYTENVVSNAVAHNHYCLHYIRDWGKNDSEAPWNAYAKCWLNFTQVRGKNGLLAALHDDPQISHAPQPSGPPTLLSPLGGL